MDELHSSKILLTLNLLIFLFQLSSLPFLSSAYTPPEQYFINCGSTSNTTVNGRNFIGDISSRSFSLTGKSNPVKDTNQSSSTSPLYQTARIFTQPSWYELEIAENGTYLVRLHFYPISSSNNISDAQFNVSASGFSLLSNFRPQKSDNLPVIQEFLISIGVGKFGIYFTPFQETRTFAFVNAVEVFLAPDGFVPDSATRVSPSGRKSNYNDLKSNALRTINRINVGGVKLTQDNDTLWRNWVPDDEYLYLRDAAKNSDFYGTKPKYQSGGATEYFAPDPVYRTAKQLNIDSARVNNFFNVTWRFNVSKNATLLVRAHFCNIISPALEPLKFNLYIYSEFGLLIDPTNYYPQLGAPFYYDFVVDTDNSGVLKVSIGPRDDSVNQTAFLNGLEIMELMTNLSTGPEKSKQKKKEVPIIIGSVVGGVAFVFVKKGQLEKVVDPFIVDDIRPNSLRKFGETAEKCLKDYGVDRPTMIDVVWDLEYALQLQQTIKLREPHEDSTIDVSWELPLPVVQRLPSYSIPIDEDEMPVLTDDGLATSYTNASDIFSQLRIDDAR
ncbi:hypothetical protein RJ639_018911 [Escallonia herrerae]|uniref:Malectin-like domain-containing protein n=1 Tax=Escallonia herrerae TaxID=1293975 RepID=A0AA88VBL2_9ASTE|nr:hypothetical protein RJ639_018911 [Escallonia herrerae]